MGRRVYKQLMMMTFGGLLSLSQPELREELEPLQPPLCPAVRLYKRISKLFF